MFSFFIHYLARQGQARFKGWQQERRSIPFNRLAFTIRRTHTAGGTDISDSTTSKNNNNNCSNQRASHTAMKHNRYRLQDLTHDVRCFSLCCIQSVRFRDVSNKPIESLNQISHNMLLVFNNVNTGESLEAQRFQIDITPSKSILTKGGHSEYDTVSAISELLDNSIQAVRGNLNGNPKRQIQLRILSDPKPVNV
jgi:hypothetical protein